MTKFRMVKRRLYWWPVPVRFPDPDPKRAGRTLEQTFTAQFEEMPLDEARLLEEEIAALPHKEQLSREHDLLVRVVKSWADDVVDEQEQPIPFSAEALHEALQSAYVRAGLYTAWVQSLTGADAPKAKN